MDDDSQWLYFPTHTKLTGKKRCFASSDHRYYYLFIKKRRRLQFHDSPPRVRFFRMFFFCIIRFVTYYCHLFFCHPQCVLWWCLLWWEFRDWSHSSSLTPSEQLLVFLSARQTVRSSWVRINRQNAMRTRRSSLLRHDAFWRKMSWRRYSGRERAAIELTQEHHSFFPFENISILLMFILFLQYSRCQKQFLTGAFCASFLPCLFIILPRCAHWGLGALKSGKKLTRENCFICHWDGILTGYRLPECGTEFQAEWPRKIKFGRMFCLLPSLPILGILREGIDCVSQSVYFFSFQSD